MKIQFVTISTAGRRRLMRLSDIVEIVPMMALEPVDNGAKNCRGLANLRGENIPIFELSDQCTPLSPSRFIVISRVNSNSDKSGMPIGLIADEIHDVIQIPSDQISRRALSGGQMALIARIDEETLSVLEPEDAITICQ